MLGFVDLTNGTDRHDSDDNDNDDEDDEGEDIFRRHRPISSSSSTQFNAFQTFVHSLLPSFFASGGNTTTTSSSSSSSSSSTYNNARPSFVSYPGADNPIPAATSAPEPESDPTSHEDAVEKLKKHLKCPICQDVLQEPTTTKCGHMFCAPCIRVALSMKKQCPSCRTKLTQRQLVRVYF